MLDPRFISENADAVKRNAAAKNERRADIDRINALTEARKKLQQEVDAANTQIRALSKKIADAKKADPKADVASIQAQSKAVGTPSRPSRRK